MRVSEVMTPAPIQVNGETPIATCALRMIHLGIRHLPVVSEHGRLAGIVTDAAVQRHGAVWGGEFVSYGRSSALTAADLAVPAEVVARPDDALPAMMRRLAATRQDCIVVVDGRDHPIGMLTEHDLLKVALLPSRADPLVKCATRMLELRVGCLPVIERGRAVAIVTRRDLVDTAVTGLEAESLFEDEPTRVRRMRRRTCSTSR